MNKRYVVTIEIRDGEHEYFSTCQHQLDPEEMDKAEDRDAYILKDVHGYDHVESWSGWWEADNGYDYRLYRVHSLKEIEEPEHVELLQSYGIY